MKTLIPKVGDLVVLKNWRDLEPIKVTKINQEKKEFSAIFIDFDSKTVDNTEEYDDFRLSDIECIITKPKDIKWFQKRLSR